MLVLQTRVVRRVPRRRRVVVQVKGGGLLIVKQRRRLTEGIKGARVGRLQAENRVKGEYFCAVSCPRTVGEK